MKITSTTCYENIEYDERDFRRFKGGTWEERYGESWEAVYTEEKELEERYQLLTTASPVDKLYSPSHEQYERWERWMAHRKAGTTWEEAATKYDEIF